MHRSVNIDFQNMNVPPYTETRLSACLHECRFSFCTGLCAWKKTSKRNITVIQTCCINANKRTIKLYHTFFQRHSALQMSVLNSCGKSTRHTAGAKYGHVNKHGSIKGKPSEGRGSLASHHRYLWAGYRVTEVRKLNFF